MKEGLAIALGLAVTGLLLQLSIGPVEWALFVWPANAITALLLVVLLVVGFWLRRRCYFFAFMGQAEAAVPAIAVAAVMTIIMGLTRQVSATSAPSDMLGLSKMLSFWPFVLAYLWMSAIVGMTTLGQLAHFAWRRVPSLLCHIGLFIVIVCGTLGHADMQRLKMYCEQGQPEWRGLTEQNDVVELPLAIQLNKFSIDEWPPKLMVIDANGLPYPKEKPFQLQLDSTLKQGVLGTYKVEVKAYHTAAMPSAMGKMMGGMPEQMMARMRMDSLGMAVAGDKYEASKRDGAAPAVLVAVSDGQKKHEGWVSCGSYRFPYQTLKLTDSLLVAMATPEPARYYSQVTVVTQDGQQQKAEVSVNHPLHIAGWDIYQYSYNTEMGRWSKLSIFELVSDPWLPTVYVGLYLLLAGAVLTFATAGRKPKKS